MIPREAPRAKNSPGGYYLRDKNGMTNERVEFTYTVNLPTDDPELALKVMEATAGDQTAIKQQAGLKHPGRKSEKPFYTFSLSWHPEENPESMQMIDTGKSVLERLGLQQHQTVMVSHNDTDHKHIHCIVNLVHPETGLTGNLKHSRLILSKWAQEYEQQNRIFCEQRIENNAKRTQNEYTVYDGYKHKQRFQGWEHFDKLDPKLQNGVHDHLKKLEKSRDRNAAKEYILFLKNHVGADLQSYLENQNRKREMPLPPTEAPVIRQKPVETPVEPPKRQETRPTARTINRVQDRRNEERARLSDQLLRRKAILKETLDAQYGEHEKRLNEKMSELNEIMQDKRRLWILQRSGQDPEAEMENIKLSLGNIAWRRQEAESALENNYTGEKQVLEQRQEAEKENAPQPEKGEPAKEFDARAAFMERHSQESEQGMDFEP